MRSPRNGGVADARQHSPGEKLPAMVADVVTDLERAVGAPLTAQSIAERTLDAFVLTIAETLPDD
jgi:hypothetical protein